MLALTVAAVSAIHLLVIIQLAFFGGDWCWGPRYAVTILPLWALALPFVTLSGRARRLAAPLAAAGLVVQLLGISLDYHRFFYDRNLPPNFWAADPWVYFKQSQLISRPFELYRTWRTGLPAEAERFSAAPNGQVTYCPFGPRQAERSRMWERQYAVFFLPRPWPGWMWRIRPELRPVDPGPWLVLCAALLALGSAAVMNAVRRSPLQRVEQGVGDEPGVDRSTRPQLAQTATCSDQGYS